MNTDHMSYHHIKDIVREMTTNSGKSYVLELYHVSDDPKQMIRRWEEDRDFNEYTACVRDDVLIAMNKIKELIGEPMRAAFMFAWPPTSTENLVTLSKDHYDLLVRLAAIAMEKME